MLLSHWNPPAGVATAAAAAVVVVAVVVVFVASAAEHNRQRVPQVLSAVQLNVISVL